MATRRRVLKAVGASGTFLIGSGAAAADGTARTTGRSQPNGSATALDDRIDVFVIGGQSNAKGLGDASKSPAPPSGTAYEFENDTGNIVELDDPVGVGQYGAATGSAWPAFAEKYFDRTGQKAAYIPTAVGRSAQVAAVRDGSPDSQNHWDAGGARRGDTVNMTERAMDALRNEGFQPRLRGMLWSQGESDANAIDSGTISIEDYKRAFSEMLGYFRNNIQDHFPIWIFQTGKPSTGDTSGFRKIRSAQADFPTTEQDVQMVSTVQKNFPDKGWIAPHRVSTQELGVLSHVYHYSQRGYNVMGETGAENLEESSTLTIEENDGSWTTYGFSVSGKVTPRKNVSGVDEISADGTRATGGVVSGYDSYTITGGITSLSLSSDATLYLNGTQVDVEKYLPDVLTVRNHGSWTTYEFAASGGVAPRAGLGSADEVHADTGRATGGVGNGSDSYYIAGELTDVSVEGTADVYRNGELLDVGGERTLRIVETGDSWTTYGFSVSGSISPRNNIGGADEISADGQRATGGVIDGSDGYTITGEITSLSLSGDATVYLDGEALNVEEYLPDVLTVEGSGSWSTYEFAASGGVAPRTGLGGADEVDADAGRATGGVVSGDDSYLISGKLTTINVDGNATVYRNGQRVQ
ncbi:sialate O-acetylesterase [Halococcus agarilyticus]|uniref:sialate O-acetylesterase n=1 Tax=Halococcus agarilyticus TaxID=1232219 RepID=UPI0009ADCDC5|nr:sialate O-acetylesterase [Halococcus agarilyticus]